MLSSSPPSLESFLPFFFFFSRPCAWYWEGSFTSPPAFLTSFRLSFISASLLSLSWFYLIHWALLTRWFNKKLPTLPKCFITVTTIMEMPTTREKLESREFKDSGYNCVSILIDSILFLTLFISHLFSFPLFPTLLSVCVCFPSSPFFSPICYASRKSVFWISCVSTAVRPTRRFLTKYYSSLFFSPSVASCSPPPFLLLCVLQTHCTFTALVLVGFISFLSSFVLSSCSCCWFISASCLQVLIYLFIFFNPQGLWAAIMQSAWAKCPPIHTIM